MNNQNVPTPTNNRQVTLDQPSTTRTDNRGASKPDRREYFREYYRKNRERAREYQREYSLRYRRKARPISTAGRPMGARQAIRGTYTITDIMRSPTEKTVRMLEGILNGDRHFTM
ncbi:MAG: hypothetical protein KKA42_11590 [candidate division Zixibacteria bacterium]|nr:hypothetical protein [candidate division Zixibacteria bacterium]